MSEKIKMIEEIKMADIIADSENAERKAFGTLPVEEQIRREAFKYSLFAYEYYIKVDDSPETATEKAHKFFLAYLKYKPCFNELQANGASYEKANAKAKEISGIDLV